MNGSPQPDSWPDIDDEPQPLDIDNLPVFDDEPVLRPLDPPPLDDVDAARAGALAAVPDLDPSWLDVDLGQVLRGDELDRPRLILGLFYVGSVNGVHAEPEAGKSWLALYACAEELRAGDHVVYIDHEDSAPRVIARLRALGIPDRIIREQFHYRRPDVLLGARTAALLASMRPFEPTLCVIDGITEALAAEGLNPDKAVDVATYAARVPRPIADELGTCVLDLDHVTKDRETRGRWASGSGHKLAGATGTTVALDVVEPITRTGEGRIRVLVAKDRLGYVRATATRRHNGMAHVRDLRSTPYPDGGLGLSLEVPHADEMPRTPEGRPAPTILMGRVVDFLRDRGPLVTDDDPESWSSARDVRDHVTGNDRAIGDALVALVELGCVDHRTGKRGAHRYRFLHTFDPDSLGGDNP